MRFAMSGLASSQLPTMKEVMATWRLSNTSSNWSTSPRSPLVWKVSATRGFVDGRDTTKRDSAGAVQGGGGGAVVAGTVVGAPVVAAPLLALPSSLQAAASAPSATTAPARKARRGTGEGAS